jgi:hypothetical protein
MSKPKVSIIGACLTPDFSEAEDPGKALYDHMQELTGLLRAAVCFSHPENESPRIDVHDLIALFQQGFEAGLEEFDNRDTERSYAAFLAKKKAEAPGSIASVKPGPSRRGSRGKAA